MSFSWRFWSRQPGQSEFDVIGSMTRDTVMQSCLYITVCKAALPKRLLPNPDINNQISLIYTSQMTRFKACLHISELLEDVAVEEAKRQAFLHKETIPLWLCSSLFLWTLWIKKAAQTLLKLNSLTYFWFIVTFI